MTEHTKCKLSQQVEEVVTTQNGHPVKLDNLPTCITIATFSWAAPAAVVDCDCGTGRYPDGPSGYPAGLTVVGVGTEGAFVEP